MNFKKNTLENPLMRQRFMKWVEKNLCNPDSLEKIDWMIEFADDLTYSEAIDMALYKFPTLWKYDSADRYYNRVKQIVFIKELIPKILDGRVQVTYRKTPKIGYYYIIDNRFRSARDPKIILEFYRTEQVDPYKLTDDEARLAGIETSRELLSLFKRWYGNPVPKLFRNWFTVKFD